MWPDPGIWIRRNIYGSRTLLATDCRVEMPFSVTSAVVGKRVNLGAVFMYFIFRKKEAQLPRKPSIVAAPISGATRARICKRLWSPGIDAIPRNQFRQPM
jgi:hypothetical protein